MLHSADFGTLRLSDLQVTPVWEVADSRSRSGALSRSVGGMLLQVRIECLRFSDPGLVRKLRNMANHLERGGSVGFTLDTGKLWGGFASGHSTPGLIYQGHRLVTTPGSNAWSGWSAGALVDDDPIVIQSCPPESILEHHTMNGTLGATATQVNFDADTENDMSNAPFLVRYRDFWPCLKMSEAQVRSQAGREVVHSNRRLHHTLDITLIEDWGALRAIEATGSAALPGATEQSRIKFAAGLESVGTTARGVDYSDHRFNSI